MREIRQQNSRLWVLWLVLLLVVALSAGMILIGGPSAAGVLRLGSDGPVPGQGERPVEPSSQPKAVAETAVSETGTPGSGTSETAETQVVLEPAEAEVVEAFDCARAKNQLPAYVRDPELDAEANKILTQLRDDPTTPGESEANYPLFAHLTVDLAVPKSGCSVGDFDVARIGKAELEKAQHIGIAVASTTLYDQSLQMVIVIGQ